MKSFNCVNEPKLRNLLASKSRDRIDIMAEILETTRNGASKTRILRQARLSFPMVNKYLTFMLKVNLLEKVEQNGMNIYKPTKKGFDFLQRYSNLVVLLIAQEEDCKSNVNTVPSHLLRKSKSVAYIPSARFDIPSNSI